MCGIVGFWQHGPIPEELWARLAKATACLGHRGPDGSGMELVAGFLPERPLLKPQGSKQGAVVVFGHRRLAIIDLSAGGHQPMRDPETGNWITFNGEIYNFRELRAELERKGFGFRSNSDTEVILKAYAAWGTGAFQRLRGIFAFGFWNAVTSQLHLVRDHLGVKPLYYYQSERGLLFGSEVRALLATGLIPRVLDHAGLVSYLKYGSLQEPCTLVREVHSLLPGHYLTLGPGSRAVQRHYWRIGECLAADALSAEAGAAVKGELERSVRRQLVADVPVGVFLSSGIDSSAIAALAVEAGQGQVRTFCVGFEDKTKDEREGARATAEKLGCLHTELLLAGAEVRAELPAALRGYDQPSSDGLNTYFISKLVRQAGIKVALSGLGGDELFHGYGNYVKALSIERLGRKIWPLRPVLGVLTGGLMTSALPAGSSIGSAILELLAGQISDPYFCSRVVYALPHLQRMLVPEVGAAVAEAPWWAREARLEQVARSMVPEDRISYLEMQTYMLSTLLRDSDQMSMVHGLELRVPLVDPGLVECILPLPLSRKLSSKVPKSLLVSAVSQRLPELALPRAKRGFELPLDRWLREDLRDLVEPVFSSRGHAGFWRRGVLPGLWDSFQRRRISWSRIWTIFVLETWLQENRITL